MREAYLLANVIISKPALNNRKPIIGAKASVQRIQHQSGKKQDKSVDFRQHRPAKRCREPAHLYRIQEETAQCRPDNGVDPSSTWRT